MLKQEGTEKYEILTVNEKALKKFNMYKKLLIYVNIPAVVLLPIICELFLDFSHPKANALYALLYTADTFLFMNAYMIYKMLKQAILSINYLVDEEKFEIAHFSKLSKKLMSKLDDSSKSTSQNVEVVDPQNLAKASKSMFSSFVGYRNTSTDQKYITEGMCTWHDRHFFDSIIERAKEKKGPKVSERVKSKPVEGKDDIGNPLD